MLQSIYTHAGCDYGCLYTYSPRHCFNPHTHAGCDNVHNVSGASFPVSIHTPTQGVTAATIFCSEFNKFQSTHPRRVWHWLPIPYFDDILVSIHTPTQGVTQARYVLIYPVTVSIHTPTQGVTWCGADGWYTVPSFNPHTHAGCDTYKNLITIDGKVSIHTPTQGVTRRFEWEVCGTGCFNPHTHAGCDHVWIHSCHCSDVSIHTPTQGVTPNLQPASAAIRVSIHTPTQGVTTIKLRQPPPFLFVSIHTPTQGVTLYLITYYKSANLIHCYANHHYYSTS